MMKAKDVMTREVVSLDKDERLSNVLELMRKRGASKFPVTERGELVGLLIDGDVADELGAIRNRGVATAQLHVSSCMRRRFPTAMPDTPLEEVLYQMIDQDVHLVPVVHDRTIVGVVTASDLITRVTSNQPVSAFMTRNLDAVSPTDRVIHARRLMVDHHVERLPVLESGRLVGIVGERDVALGLWKFRETVSVQHQTAQLREFTVDQIMQRQVVTIDEAATAKEAAKRMRENDVGSLCVLRGDRIAGIVTRTDLLKLLEL
jgi:CBS domain-containing protein